MTFLLAPGPRREPGVFDRLMAGGAARRGVPGRPKRHPHGVVGDKGCGSRKIRQYFARHQIRRTIPQTGNEYRTDPFTRAIYRERNRVERLINRYKQFHRLVTRYGKRAENHRAM